jgi:zinc protease
VSIELGADPKRIDELNQAMFEEIGRLQNDGPDEDEVKEVRIAESRDYETSSRQNGWWLSLLAEQYRLGEDPAEVVRIPVVLDLITKDMIRKAAQTYFDTGRYVQVTLYPEKK